MAVAVRVGLELDESSVQVGMHGAGWDALWLCLALGHAAAGCSCACPWPCPAQGRSQPLSCLALP